MTLRREPPRFRRLAVHRVTDLGPYARCVTIGGPELDGFAVPEPAASVRVLLPATRGGAPEVPTWNGNEFLLADGRRPPIRTFTPLRVNSTALELDVEVVLHDSGAASEWVRTAQPGDEIALSGPGRGYTVDAVAPAFLVGGDETALPAITQLLEVLPNVPVAVHIEIAHPGAQRALPDRAGCTASWHVAEPGAQPGAALVAAITAAPIAPGERVWIAGEAAAVQRIRRELFETRTVPRTQTTIRGYWKHGRAGGTDEA